MPRRRVAWLAGSIVLFATSKDTQPLFVGKKAAALNELKVELAGGDDRNPETRVAEDTSYSLQLNNVAADRVHGVGGKTIFLDVLINDQHLEMELDTGARFSVIPEHLKWPEVQLQHTDVRLVAYGGASVQIIGKAYVIVSCNKHAISAYVLL